MSETGAELQAMIAESTALWSHPPKDEPGHSEALARADQIDRRILASRPSDPAALAAQLRWLADPHTDLGARADQGRALMLHIADRLEAGSGARRALRADQRIDAVLLETSRMRTLLALADAHVNANLPDAAALVESWNYTVDRLREHLAAI